MSKTKELHDPWLLAVWPGMGSVATVAGHHLLHQLRPRRAASFDLPGLFEVHGVDVKNGIAVIGRVPMNTLFEWKDPEKRHDLLIFVGEAQPARGGYGLCQKLIDDAATRGVEQVFTFAAMATGLELGHTPRTLAVATDATTLKQSTTRGIEVLEEGQIGGLNGALLAAAAERGLHGTCLLGEIPYFATEVPNPRAAQAVLEKFGELSQIHVGIDSLTEEAEVLEEKLRQMIAQFHETEGESETADAAEHYGQIDIPSTTRKPKVKRLDEKLRERIEALFEAASRDRSKAVELKQELDRSGVFKRYENRFLDLFRKAE